LVSPDVYLAALQPDNDLYPAKKAMTSLLFVVFLLSSFKNLSRKFANPRYRVGCGQLSGYNLFDSSDLALTSTRPSANPGKPRFSA
jgi:hypothetical protein